MYDFKIAAADTATLYRDLASALEGLVSGEPDPIANMANAAALIWESLPDLNWAGFYRNLAASSSSVHSRAAPPASASRSAPASAAPPPRRCSRSGSRTSTPSPATSPAIPRPPANSSSRSSATGELLAVLDLDSPRTGRFTAEDEAGCVRLAEILAKVL